MCSWSRLWTKGTKKQTNKQQQKNSIAISEDLGEKIGCWEQKQGTERAPCKHDQQRSGQSTCYLSGQTPGLIPTLTPYKKQACPPWGAS